MESDTAGESDPANKRVNLNYRKIEFGEACQVVFSGKNDIKNEGNNKKFL